MSSDKASVLRRVSAWVDKKDASFFFYLGAQVASALISIVSIRYVVAFVTREQYGEWGFLGTLSAILVPILTLSLPQAMMRMYFDRRDDEVEAQRTLVSTTFVLNAYGAIVLVVSVAVLHLAGVLSPLRAAYFALVTTGALAMNFFNYLIRIRNHYVLYFVCRMIESAGYLCAILLLTRIFPAPPPGPDARLIQLLWAGAAPAALAATLAAVIYAKSGILSLRAQRLDAKEIRGLISFSLPLSVTFFVGWVLSSSDIAVLRRLSTLGDTADYVFSLSIVSVVALVSQSALLDWPRFYYAEMRDDRPGRDAKIAKKAVSFLLIHAVTILGVRSLASLAYDLLGADEYRAGLDFLSFLLLGNFCFLAGNLFAVGMGYAKRTQLTLLTFVIPAVVNVGLNLILVPRFGAVAAAVTTLISFALFALLSLLIGWRFYRFQNLPRFALAFAAATLAAFVPLG